MASPPPPLTPPAPAQQESLFAKWRRLTIIGLLAGAALMGPVVVTAVLDAKHERERAAVEQQISSMEKLRRIETTIESKRRHWMSDEDRMKSLLSEADESARLAREMLDAAKAEATPRDE